MFGFAAESEDQDIRVKQKEMKKVFISSGHLVRDRKVGTEELSS